ncbi:MAG: hypothetical protein H0U55_06495 [Rubrobacteraceae bacterium]|nr:hypothetical protein [Rubrobacteraceae bacterium]
MDSEGRRVTESLFANAPQEHVEGVLREQNLPVDRVTTPYTCLLVDTREHRMLVDTGAGDLGHVRKKEQGWHWQPPEIPTQFADR